MVAALVTQLGGFFYRAENSPRRNEHQQMLGHCRQSSKIRIAFIVKNLRVIRIIR